MEQGPERRNVLFVMGSRFLYGSEFSLLPVVRRLKSSWQPCFLVEGEGPLDTFLREGGFPVYRLTLDVESRPRRALRLVQISYLLRSLRIQLVYMNLHFQAGLVSKACSLAGIPILVHVRNMIDRPVKSVFRNCDGIICISQAVCESLTAQGRVSLAEVQKRLWIIPDGRELSPFRAANGERVRREFGIEPSVPLVGMAARICPMKGQDTFIRMAALVKQRIPTARFLLIGSKLAERDEPYFRGLHELVRALRLENDVIFAGYRRDMPEVLAAMNCFAHPSRQGAFVSVLIEAMASGVPVVASDVDGIPECVGRDGAAAVLLPPEDPRAWADATGDILLNPERAARMAARGRERASRLFEIAPLANLTADVMETVHARRSGTHYSDWPAGQSLVSKR